jgi:hypothetical protein
MYDTKLLIFLICGFSHLFFTIYCKNKTIEENYFKTRYKKCPQWPELEMDYIYCASDCYKDTECGEKDLICCPTVVDSVTSVPYCNFCTSKQDLSNFSAFF